MLEFLKNSLAGHNQFASGGLLLMIIGGLSGNDGGIPGFAVGRGTRAWKVLPALR
jgi:hypothetical protein